MSDQNDKPNGAQSLDVAMRFLGLDYSRDSQDGAAEAEMLAWADRLLPLEAGDCPPPPVSVWATIAEQVGVAPGIRTVRSDEGVWETLGQGLRRKIVHIDADVGRASYFLELAAGSQLPEHDHPEDEHCVILEGTIRIGSQVFEAGAYQFAKSGHPHPPIIAETPALVFIHGPA